MTFKKFVKWCNERACDGCWDFRTAMVCCDIVQEIRRLPFWKREKAWKKIEADMLAKIVNPINRKIQELQGDVIRGRGSGK